MRIICVICLYSTYLHSPLPYHTACLNEKLYIIVLYFCFKIGTYKLESLIHTCLPEHFRFFGLFLIIIVPKYSAITQYASHLHRGNIQSSIHNCINNRYRYIGLWIHIGSVKIRKFLCTFDVINYVTATFLRHNNVSAEMTSVSTIIVSTSAS